MNRVLQGEIYRHYKNKHLYQVIELGTLESTGEVCVIYKRVHDAGNNDRWIRPYNEFNGLVGDVRRFELVADDELIRPRKYIP